jgi:hypothetical membrane protein
MGSGALGHDSLSLSRSIRIVGLSGAAVGVLTVVAASVAYAREREFSLFSTYLSDLGNTPGWPAALFNTGMLVVSPLRFGFLVLLLIALGRLGAAPAWRHVAIAVGSIAVLGSIGTAAVPFGLDRPLHMASAFAYFLGTVGLQCILASLEWRARLPRVLPALCLSVALVYVVFAVLLALVGRVPGVTRGTPVVWEWLAFLSLMLWLVAHATILGSRRSS